MLAMFMGLVAGGLLQFIEKREAGRHFLVLRASRHDERRRDLALVCFEEILDGLFHAYRQVAQTFEKHWLAERRVIGVAHFENELLHGSGASRPRQPPDASQISQAQATRGLRNSSVMKNQTNESGKIGWILLWLIGVPIPILLILFLIRGCT